MRHPLRALSPSAMRHLAQALRAGHLASPFDRSHLTRYVPAREAEPTQAALSELAEGGMTGAHIATLLELLAAERASQQRTSDRLELVLSPPELDRVDARDTTVVVADLFRRATRSVRIVSFALDKGDKARSLFGELADRLDAEPALRVALYANVHRPHQDATPPGELVRAFARRFREAIWPGARLPEVYYDPRAVAPEGKERASLHAKCVVADTRWSLITSANFTEAAHERNIEAGLLVDDEHLARRLERQLDALTAKGHLLPLPRR